MHFANYQKVGRNTIERFWIVATMHDGLYEEEEEMMMIHFPKIWFLLLWFKVVK